VAKNDDYDLEQIYDEQIAPLMDRIIDICKAHKLPMFSTFVYACDGSGENADLCTTNLLFPEDRPLNPEVDSLINVVMPKRSPALRMRVRNKDGVVTNETVILP